MREAADHPLLETLVSYLKRQRLLLVLDNCEHVIEEIRTIVSAILRGAPGVRVLATSREGLAIAGEAVYRLPSLAVPPLRKGAIAARDVRDYGAVALFCDRAFGADRRFTLTDANAPFVAEICRRLDGIPLAIELAAARVNVLSPKDLAAKLDERFRLLAGGDRRALPRQRTMRALIDWSYDLLAEPERRAFRQLSIFADSFTLEMASAVAAGEGDDAIAVLDRLASLVDKSLVANEPGHALTRFRLSESTRQYAREKLVDCGEDVAAAGAHAAVMLDLAERLEREYDELPDGVWLASVQAELENWRAALGWALTARGDILLGQRLAGSLRRAWTFLAAAEGRRWIRAALDQVAAATPPATVAPLELGEAQLDATLGQHKAALAAAGRALARYRELGDALGVAGAQGTAGRALVAMGQIADGEALLDEALPAARTHKARKLIGGILGSLGFARNQLGDLSGARARYSEAAAIYRESGAAMLEADIVSNLAETEFRGGDAQTALRLVGDAVALERSANRHADSIAFDLCNEAAYLLALERFDEARDRAREALEMSHSVNDEVAVVIALQHLAAIATLRRDRDAASASDDRRRAARLLGYVDATIAALEALREYTEQREYDATLAALRVALGEDDLARLTLDGRTWEDDRAIAEARLLA